MSFRIKLFTILGLSQAFLAIFLITTFLFLIENIKNEPQEKRAFELAENFQNELRNKQKTLQDMVYNIKQNPVTLKLLQSGYNNRRVYQENIAHFEKIMHHYNLDVFEIGDKNGRVLFRFHRPKDFGDDKSKQQIIRSALTGKQGISLEIGHSGLALRLADSLPEGATIHIGYVVNDEFVHKISGGKNIHLVLTRGNEIISASDHQIRDFVSKHDKLEDKKRIKIENNTYFMIRVPYIRNGKNYLSLQFQVFIDETEINKATNKIWTTFMWIVFTLIGISILLSYFLSKDVIGAVRGLSNAMQNFDEDETMYIDATRKDEIGNMGNIFIQMKSELKEYQKDLENKVNQRTEELQQSLQKIQKMKEIQDGDYYLTSLLINPLAKTLIESQSVEIETLVRQKKRFQFRNREAEIGGDLCIADRLVLKNRHYIVFMNADAMGKSIQGAGGALVAGTVFKSIIQNTKNIPTFTEKHPEKWLKDCLNELQNVFISFDGSMLISAIIGLICEETGTLFFFNSEHPFSILHRDGKATFLDKETLIRKIGIEQDFRFLKIHVHALKPGDSILLGSDGRDDILLPQDDGNKIMNEDETLILSIIQEANAELHSIEKMLNDRGEITDDFTMMKISFKKSLLEVEIEEETQEKISQLKVEGRQAFLSGNSIKTFNAFEKAYQINPNDIYIQKELIKLYLKESNYEKALQLSYQYLQHKPADTDVLFYSSFILKKLRRFQEAADFGERVLLRHPEHRENILNLAEIYSLDGNSQRANYLLELIDDLQNFSI